MTAKPYTDPTTGEWVGEHETPLQEGTVSRQTEWFTTEQEARHFARTGQSTVTCRRPYAEGVEARTFTTPTGGRPPLTSPTPGGTRCHR